MGEEQERPQLPLYDNEAGARYIYVVHKGRELFADSALVDETKPITEADIALIKKFHEEVSPQNPQNPYKLTQKNTFEKNEIRDTSSYGNWESPGGPLEHINLASEAARYITEQLQLEGVDPLHAAAAAALHDEGRQVTHLFYTNDRIGKRMFAQDRIGVRPDITSVLPTEDVMLTPRERSMDEVIEALPPEAVIIRIADEFGKRFPKSNRLYQPEDYDKMDRQKWADGYTTRPQSGRPSDAMWRKKKATTR